MDSNRRAQQDTPKTDYELVGDLLMISAVSKTLAKELVQRSTPKQNYGGGGRRGRRKKTQHSRTKF